MLQNGLVIGNAPDYGLSLKGEEIFHKVSVVTWIEGGACFALGSGLIRIAEEGHGICDRKNGLREIGGRYERFRYLRGPGEGHKNHRKYRMESQVIAIVNNRNQGILREDFLS